MNTMLRLLDVPPVFWIALIAGVIVCFLFSVKKTRLKRLAEEEADGEADSCAAKLHTRCNGHRHGLMAEEVYEFVYFIIGSEPGRRRVWARVAVYPSGVNMARIDYGEKLDDDEVLIMERYQSAFNRQGIRTTIGLCAKQPDLVVVA